jgi:hypothetical protein
MAGRNRGYDKLGQDFTFWWRGARAVVAGENPYEVIQPVGAYPFNGKLTYPLPAALITVPTAEMPATTAAAVFVGTGFAVLAYVLLGMAPWRLGVLLSAPALCVLGNGQWAPFLLAGMLAPALGWLLACKPTIGAALFLWKPNRKAFLGALAISLVALLVLPSWPLDFLRALVENPHRSQYRPPLMMPGASCSRSRGSGGAGRKGACSPRCRVCRRTRSSTSNSH